YPTRVRIKSSASLNVPPGSVVDVVRFPLVFMFVFHRKPRRWRCNGTFIRNSCLILQSTGLRSRRWRSCSKSEDWPLSPLLTHCRVCEHGVSQERVWLIGQHCHLNISN